LLVVGRTLLKQNESRHSTKLHRDPNPACRLPEVMGATMTVRR
jgi:hypothetical protein